MELTVLTVPDCPNAAAFEERLAAALAGRPADAGMHGSPTLLIDGTDPFAAPGQPPSLSCRLYRDAAGRTGAVPSVQELRRVLSAGAG